AGRRIPLNAAWTASLPSRASAGFAFRVALEAVVGDRLPLAGVVDEGVPLRPEPVARVEEPEPDASDLPGVGVLAPERAAAGRAEALRPAVLRRVLPHELLTGEQAEGAGSKTRLRGSRRAGAPLAAGAMAVAGSQRLLIDLEAHASAHAVPGVEGVAHCPSGDGGMRVSPPTPSITMATSSS